MADEIFHIDICEPEVININITEQAPINIALVESEPIKIEIKETVMAGTIAIFEPPEGAKRITKLFWKDGKFQGEYIND